MTDSDTNKNLNIETMQSSFGGEVSFCPERGGIITSLKLVGKEILYFDTDTFKDVHTNVRGGIPILFPNAGVLESKEYSNLKQHGFARNSSAWKFQRHPKGFMETLIYNEDSYKLFPHKFKLSLQGIFEDNGSFSLLQEIENTEDNKNLPLSMGLHPYFKVLHTEKKNIKFNFEGGKHIEEKFTLWSNGTYISIENPKIKNPGDKIEIVIPDLGTIVMDISVEYQKIWIWALPGKDFVCIEPVMRDVGGIVADPYIVKPKDTFSLYMNLKINQ